MLRARKKFLSGFGLRKFSDNFLHIHAKFTTIIHFRIHIQLFVKINFFIRISGNQLMEPGKTVNLISVFLVTSKIFLFEIRAKKVF